MYIQKDFVTFALFIPKNPLLGVRSRISVYRPHVYQRREVTRVKFKLPVTVSQQTDTYTFV